MKIFNVLYLILMIFICSCEKDVDVDIPEFEQKLVANCWFTDDGDWYLRVSKTRYILDDGLIELVDNAEVKIYEEDSLIEILPYIIDGIYGLSNGYVAEVNKTYRLLINCDGYPELSATEILLEKPNVLSINIDVENRIMNNNMIGYYANIYFNNIHESQNFYHLLVYRDYITQERIEENEIIYYPGDTIYNDIVHFHVDEMIDNDICHLTSWFVEDRYFPDSNTPLQLLIDQNSFENTVCFNFIINRITENYYNYGNVIDSYSNGGLIELNGMAYGYSEPSQISTNINNGYGIFASYNGLEFKILNN